MEGKRNNRNKITTPIFIILNLFMFSIIYIYCFDIKTFISKELIDKLIYFYGIWVISTSFILLGFTLFAYLAYLSLKKDESISIKEKEVKENSTEPILKIYNFISDLVQIALGFLLIILKSHIFIGGFAIMGVIIKRTSNYLLKGKAKYFEKYSKAKSNQIDNIYREAGEEAKRREEEDRNK